MADPLRPHWHGMLCAENRAAIAQQMRTVLDGKWFTVVTCNSFDETSRRFSHVEVTTGQFLCGALVEHDGDLAGLSWVTPRHVMGVHTEARTQDEGRNGSPHDYVSFTFEPDRVTIEHYAPARYFLQWVFVVEDHDRDLAGAPGREVSARG